MKLNWLNPLKGVSAYYHYENFQFISLDGTRSAFDSSNLINAKWTDHIIPQGKQLRKVETLLAKGCAKLFGFKWIGDDGAVLVAVGDIDDPDCRNDRGNVVTTLTLNHNQRLVGVKSYSAGHGEAWHYSF